MLREVGLPTSHLVNSKRSEITRRKRDIGSADNDLHFAPTLDFRCSVAGLVVLLAQLSASDRYKTEKTDGVSHASHWLDGLMRRFCGLRGEEAIALPGPTITVVVNQNGTIDRDLLFQDQESRGVPFRDRPVGVRGVMLQIKAIGMYIPWVSSWP